MLLTDGMREGGAAATAADCGDPSFGSGSRLAVEAVWEEEGTAADDAGDDGSVMDFWTDKGDDCLP